MTISPPTCPRLFSNERNFHRQLSVLHQATLVMVQIKPECFLHFRLDLSGRHLFLGNFRLGVLALLFQLKMEGIVVLFFRSFLPLNRFLISSGRKCCSHTLVYSVKTILSWFSCLLIAKSHRFLLLASRGKEKMKC